jgi:hypothetical protein
MRSYKSGPANYEHLQGGLVAIGRPGLVEFLPGHRSDVASFRLGLSSEAVRRGRRYHSQACKSLFEAPNGSLSAQLQVSDSVAISASNP